MKRINQYFCGGCIAFTVITIISIIMHLISNQETFQVNSEIGILCIILLIQTVLYFMENMQIKSQIAHMTFELFLIIIVTFAIGIPIKLITISSIYAVTEIILIIVAVYGITSLSLYKASKNDADDINKQLIGKQ